MVSGDHPLKPPMSRQRKPARKPHTATSLTGVQIRTSGSEPGANREIEPRNTRDIAGFFALCRETFETTAPLDPVGYKIGLESIVKSGCRNVVEVPIHFHNRLHGQSKLSLREQVNYLLHLARLYEFWLCQPHRPRHQEFEPIRRGD